MPVPSFESLQVSCTENFIFTKKNQKNYPILRAAVYPSSRKFPCKLFNTAATSTSQIKNKEIHFKAASSV